VNRYPILVEGDDGAHRRALRDPVARPDGEGEKCDDVVETTPFPTQEDARLK